MVTKDAEREPTPTSHIHVPIYKEHTFLVLTYVFM